MVVATLDMTSVTQATVTDMVRDLTTSGSGSITNNLFPIQHDSPDA